MRCSHVNVGYGEDITIRELAELIKRIVGFEGFLKFDHRKPDGNQKLLARTVKKHGRGPRVSLNHGLSLSYEHFKNFADK